MSVKPVEREISDLKSSKEFLLDVSPAKPLAVVPELAELVALSVLIF